MSTGVQPHRAGQRLRFPQEVLTMDILDRIAELQRQISTKVRGPEREEAARLLERLYDLVLLELYHPRVDG